MAAAKIGVIGGTGLYQIEGMTDIQVVHVDTPFGETSDDIVTGQLMGTGVAFLPRHGRYHHLLPNEVPSLANVYALKSLGVEFIIAINSCGSFRDDIKPGELLVPDQVIDRTSGRRNTFFGEGVVAHVSMADPFCSRLSQTIFKAAQSAGAAVHLGGTYIAMEGPAFSTRAESNLYRSWGASVIGMTVFPEAKLAREAEICYASLCCVTDYDCWKEEHVTADVIISCMQKNISAAKEIIKLAVAHLPDRRDCQCASALETAIVTNPAGITLHQKRKYEFLIGKYVT
ncbi:MAG TPA: S-methyl-5'-thioadenosine phosphorylase [Dehalococcoidales bacterium]|nr:S-methyl-5'-thioadenosine phosphorylase [Dehalococcoidales bacterium]